LREAGEDGVLVLGAVEVYRYRELQGDLEWLDMWMMCEEETKSSGGIPSNDDNKNGRDDDDNIVETTEPKHHEKPEPVLPGMHLVVGTLWSSLCQTKRPNTYGSNVNTLAEPAKTNNGVGATKEEKSSNNPAPEASEVVGSNSHKLRWRDLASIEADPADTWTCPRLSEQIQRHELSRAAGAAFDIDGVKKGLVVFYCRKDNIIMDKAALKSSLNSIYLTRCATYIGSVVAMTEARHACMGYKATTVISSPTAKKQEKPGDEEAANTTTRTSTETQESLDSIEDACKTSKWATRAVAWYGKCWDGGLQIPPPMELQQVCWTLLGAFSGMLVLSVLNELFVHLSDEEYFLVVIGPFGAQMTLLYALHSAPASQPRNVILGEAIAGAVSMTVSYAPIPQWLRRTLCPALGISAMAAAGVTHPPAGAHATIWADGQHNWYFYVFVVFCSAVSVIPATIINNLSVKRQYPVYWGYLPKWLYRSIWKED
jgi:hypothetical protein